MQDLNTVGGRIIEIRRYVTPLGFHGQDTRRERWELWFKTPNGAEEKLIVESRSTQARRGHRVVLALEAGAPVGMVNLTTRTRLNFARSAPSFLYRPLDIAVPVGLMFASLFAATTLRELLISDMLVLNSIQFLGSGAAAYFLAYALVVSSPSVANPRTPLYRDDQ